MDSFDRSVSPGETTDDTEIYHQHQPADIKPTKKEEEKPVSSDKASTARNAKNQGLSLELHAEMSKNVESHNKYIRAAEILRKIDQQNQDLLDVFISTGHTPQPNLADPPKAIMNEEQQASFDLLY